jgi:transcriptional regulator GlxA family with amidase domain
MVRLQHAKHLLKYSDRLIIATAVESGCCGSSHLIGAFGESLGMTLSAYRGRN